MVCEQDAPRHCRLFWRKAGLALARLVAALPRLECLDISGNPVGPGGIGAWAEELRKGLTVPRLRKLIAQQTDADGEKGGAALADLAAVLHLEDLDASRNNLGPEGAKAVRAVPSTRVILDEGA